MTAASDICAETIGLGSGRPNWSIIASAPTTSQVIGVLAAIIFTVVILLLQQAPHPTEDSRYRYSVRALNTLVFVFFAFAIASFLFSVITGEQMCNKAFAGGALASALFAVAGAGTFLSICWLFAAHQIGGEQVVWTKILMTRVSHFRRWC
jgi:hypothetical protein